MSRPAPEKLLAAAHDVAALPRTSRLDDDDNLPATSLLVSLSWASSAVVDLDAAALLFDRHGVLIDAAFFNNRSAGGGAVRHAGDAKPSCSAIGTTRQVEAVGIDLVTIPDEVAAIALVVHRHDGGALADAGSSTATLSALPTTVGLHPPSLASTPPPPPRVASWQRAFDASSGWHYYTHLVR